MSKLSRKDGVLLGVLAISIVALWLSRDSERLDRSDVVDVVEVMELGEPPAVRLGLLDRATAPYERKGRNLFEYREPRHRPRSAEAPPPRPVVRPPQSIPPTKTTTALPSQPARPRPAFDYIGYFGPKDELIAVFLTGAEVVVARIGDVIDGSFELLEFRYDSVILGYVGEQHKGERVRLRASSS
jgi:hypothetical protein